MGIKSLDDFFKGQFRTNFFRILIFFAAALIKIFVVILPVVINRRKKNRKICNLLIF